MRIFFHRSIVVMSSVESNVKALFNQDDNIHILDSLETKAIDFIRDVTRSGHQQEAFVVLDLDDVVDKHINWKSKLPRVTPFYGILI